MNGSIQGSGAVDKNRRRLSGKIGVPVNYCPHNPELPDPDQWLRKHGDYDCVYVDKWQLHAIVIFPGHIAKSKRDIKHLVSAVDIPAIIKIKKVPRQPLANAE